MKHGDFEVSTDVAFGIIILAMFIIASIATVIINLLGKCS